MDAFVLLLALLVGAAGVFYVYTQQQQKKAEEEARIAKEKREREEAERLQQLQKKQKPKKVDKTAELKKKQSTAEGNNAFIDESHPLLLHVLKGHKLAITSAAYSPNGRFIATASSDRTVRVFLRESLQDAKAKPHVITLEYDHATALNFSSDGRTLLVATQNGLVKLYQKLKVKPELTGEFSINHKKDVHSILMNDVSQWGTIVTCAGDSDTEVKFWSLDGKLLQVANTNQVTNYHCVASKDNRYVAVAAYTPEVKIFEITREKNGMFKKANKIMSLHGHRTGIVDLSFNGSDTLPVDRIVTTCKDGSIRLWDINVRYAQMEDPRLIKAFETSEQKALHALDMTPNGKILVAARDRKLIFISTATGKEYAEIGDAFEDAIKRVSFSTSGDEVLVQGKTAKHIKLFKTPACP